MTEFRFSPRPNRASEINWRTWGDAAFDEARQHNKPVLLAISAVWCHWCHVMDETSYSVPEIIKVINDRYVPVRVDNDERPDVNRRYNMGGWPSTVFLTPEGEIIHGGTYVAPEQMWQTLNGVDQLWSTKHDEIAQRVLELRAQEAEARKPKAGDLTADIVDNVAALVRGQYDPQFGGFGRAPKFPQVRLLRFLLDEYRRHGYPDIAHMLHKTLGAMASSGMYDKIEGGFFRYATTREWEIPHYEKMLEDNAELLAVYAEAHRTFPQAGYDRVVRDVVRWMDTVLWRDDVKAFAGSQDADEVYYELDGAGREKHGAPFVDMTFYTGWNALAVSAYVAAAAALADEAVEERAHEVMRTIATRMVVGPEGQLMHFDRGEGPRVADLLGDWAAFLQATIDEYETGKHPGALAAAVKAATAMRERLEDAENGGFFDAPDRVEPGRVAIREKPIEDNAMAADALLRLAALTGDERWHETAIRALRAFAGTYRGWGQFASSYANAVARALSEPIAITVVGQPGDAAALALWNEARAVDDPNRSTQWLSPEDAEQLEQLGFPPDRVAAYVCVGTMCSAPLTDEGSLRRELERARGRLERV
ncbi:MAG TPA: DUF255 domain-containing protein [Candidatus Limnocylindria bacterium]|nr:DUF255 domain-containing protein [Candidatus Limnocylindria bacterium]